MQFESGRSVNAFNENQKINRIDKLKRYLWNIFSSGLPVDYDIEGLRKVLLINLIILLAGITTIVLGIIEFVLNDYILCFVNFFIFLFLAGLFIYLRKTKNYHLISLVGTTVAGFFYTFLIAHGGIGNTTYMWLFTYPLIAIFLLGIRKGTVYSLLLLIMACLVFVFGSYVEFLTSYSPFVKMRFIPAYILIYFLAFIMEKTREIAQGKMNQSEARFRAIFDNAPFAIVINRMEDGRCVEANRAFLDSRGISREELVHINPADFSTMSKEEAAVIRKQLARTGSLKNIEAEIRRKDGTTGHIAFSSVVIEIEGQKQILSMTVDLTERKIAEDALKASEARFRALFTNAPIPLVSATLDGTVIKLNDRFTRVFGYTSDDLTGIDQWWKNAYPDPEYRKHVISRWEKALSNAVAGNSGVEADEYSVTCKSGRVLTMIIGANVIGDTIMVSFFDITERREREAALRENMELLRATFNATTDGILVVNKDLKVTQVNRQFYKMWQIPTELQEIDNEVTLREFVQDQLADPANFKKMVNSLYNSQIQDMSEIAFKDGRVFECYTAPMIMGGNEIGRVWDFRDISEHKRVEKALRASEHKLRSIFSSMTDVIFIFDSDGRYLEVAPTNTASMYHAPDLLLGKTLKDIFPEEQANLLFDAISQTLSHKKPVSFDHELKLGEHKVWFASIITPLSSDKVICVGRDITERKQSEQERERLQEQLYQSQKLEAVGILAGGVAHDFNNMLAGIMGYAELTIKDMDPADPLQKNLYTILDIAKRSAGLTRQLLAFARKQTIEPIIFDLNESIEAILKMIRRIIGENIELVWMPGAGSITVRMDPSQFDQIMVNLCVNARDAITDTGRITIETDSVSFDDQYCTSHTYATPGKYVLMAVSDDGCGMDKETLSHIFEPFFTTKGVGQGTGMGLPTVYGIIKQNKGFINVYSEPGQGTTIKIYLPLNIMTTDAEKESTIENIPHSQGETVLIVEDEPSILEMNLIMLQHLGYTALPAGTPGEAIRITREGSAKIQLVISDVIMPEMNGRELIEQLKRIQPEMKHLFMSGYTANIIAHQGVLDKGVNFIQKPFTLKNLAVKIREVLD